jgi:phage terminase large subunit-like protein
MLELFFAGANDTVILIPKKNGKSTLIAAIALYHLLTTPFANCICVAAARQQAQIILDQAKMFIRQSPALRSRMNVNQREITSLIDGGKIEVRASDVDTLDGVLPTLAIVDELHRHKTADVRGILRLGLGGRHGRMLTISTAGASIDSPLGVLRQRAYDMPGFARDIERRRSFVLSGSFAFIEWALNPDDDPNDLELVKLVNPRPGRTVADLEEEKEAVTKSEWLRLICGIWTEGEDPWMDAATWDELSGDVEIEDGSDVVVVAVMGAQSRTAAIAVLTMEETVRAKVHLLQSAE